MSSTTKERILEAAEEIMLAKSFSSVGLNEILAAVKVPKGSFYHYFASKEQFGAELLAHYIREHTGRLRGLLLGAELTGRERIEAYFAGTISKMLEGCCKQFCLVGKLGSEVSTFSEPMRKVLAEGMLEWRSIYEQVLTRGVTDGSIRQDLDVPSAAGFLQDCWQGAMHRSQIERSVAPLRSAAECLSAFLRSR